MTRRIFVAMLAAVLAAALPAPLVQAQELSGDSILFWSHAQQITGYRNIDGLFATREIERGEMAYPLLPDHRDFSKLSYRYGGERLTVDDYLRRMHVAGLIAVKDDRILLERYALGNDESSRWISFSVAKSVVSLLIGAAIKDGYIGSVDDKVVDYLPRLKGGSYDDVTIEHILHMASGVAWNEDYSDPESDVSQAPGGTLPLYDYMRKLPGAAAPGDTFNYNTGETNIAGAVLRAAIGNNLSTYLEHKIWRPFGMEHDASWLLEQPGGVEFGGCCINATLRDYARLGVFALRGGRLPDGTHVLPDGYLADSLAPSPGYDGYGYYWWLVGDDTYAAFGVFGQMIWIDPERNIVIALHSAWPVAGTDELRDHRATFVQALAEAL